MATSMATSLAFPLMGSAFRPTARQDAESERREKFEVEVDPEGLLCRDGEVGCLIAWLVGYFLVGLFGWVGIRARAYPISSCMIP